MASENRCPKCGEPLVPNPSFHGVFDCPKCDEGFPLDPKDCRIKELERQLEEAKAEAEKEERRHLETIDRRDAAEEACSQMYYLITGNSPHWSNVFGYAQAIEDVDDAQIALHAWGKKGDADTISLKSDLDAALDQVVALRCLIDDFFNYVGGADDPRLDDYLMDRAVDALTDTQALANQRVEAIRREAASELMQALRDYGQHQRAIPELGVKGCDYDPEEGIPCTCGLATILGEKGGDDGSV